MEHAERRQLEDRYSALRWGKRESVQPHPADSKIDSLLGCTKLVSTKMLQHPVRHHVEHIHLNLQFPHAGPQFTSQSVSVSRHFHANRTTLKQASCWNPDRPGFDSNHTWQLHRFPGKQDCPVLVTFTLLYILSEVLILSEVDSLALSAHALQGLNYLKKICLGALSWGTIEPGSSRQVVPVPNVSLWSAHCVFSRHNTCRE